MKYITELFYRNKNMDIHAKAMSEDSINFTASFMFSSFVDNDIYDETYYHIFMDNDEVCFINWIIDLNGKLYETKFTKEMDSFTARHALSNTKIVKNYNDEIFKVSENEFTKSDYWLIDKDLMYEYVKDFTESYNIPCDLILSSLKIDPTNFMKLTDENKQKVIRDSILETINKKAYDSFEIHMNNLEDVDNIECKKEHKNAIEYLVETYENIIEPMLDEMFEYLEKIKEIIKKS